MSSTFAQTAAVYRNLHILETKETLIPHALFMEYDVLVKKLRHRLKEAALVDEYARRLLRHLGGFSYACAGLPLPFGHPSVFPDDIGPTLDRILSFVSFPSQEDGEIAVNAVKLLKDLVTIGSNPILHKLVECVVNGEVGLLIAKTKYLLEVKEYLSVGYPNARVLTPHSLRRAGPLSELFLVGSPSWYPDHVYAAPRCSRIHAICYEWLYQPKTVQPLLEIAKQHEVPRTRFQQPWIGKWRKTIESFTQVDGDKDQYEHIRASLFLLEGDRAVLLEANDTSKAYVVDPEGSEDEDEETTIDRVDVQDLEPGMFVLLRIGGGGDYIVELANELMGDKCRERREKQNHWKDRLQALIRANGYDVVIEALQKAGCSKANNINVRNWANSRNIKTNDFHDFAAIMSVVGFGDRANEYWQNAEQILGAHMTAGNEIRNRLLKRVREADVSALEEQGYMEFELPIEGQEAGKIAAFRILSISSETYEVPYYRVGQSFRLEEDEWLV